MKNNNTAIDFNFNNNKLGKIGIKSISEAFNNNIKCTSLFLSNNFIDDECINNLNELLKYNCYIKKLDLSNNNINNMGLANLGLFLKNNLSIKILYLNNNLFDDDGIELFVNNLFDNHIVEQIDFNYNKELTIKSYYHLINFSKNSLSLKKFNFIGCNFKIPNNIKYVLGENISIKKKIIILINICKNLLNEKKLLHISLLANCLNDNSIKELYNELNNNKTAKSISFKNNLIQSEGIKIISNGKKKFFLLGLINFI